MDDQFIRQLRNTGRQDKERSELLITGLKEELRQRKQENPLQRWLRSRSGGRIQSTPSSNDPYSAAFSILNKSIIK